MAKKKRTDKKKEKKGKVTHAINTGHVTDDESAGDEPDMADLQTKADAFVEIVEQNKRVTETRQVMEDRRLALKSAKSEYEKACKNQEELIIRRGSKLPLFDGADEQNDKSEGEDIVCRKCGVKANNRYFVDGDLCSLCAKIIGKENIFPENDGTNKQVEAGKDKK